MKAGVAFLAGLLLLAASSPVALATSSTVVIGYFQSFDLKVNATAGNLCSVAGVPTSQGLTGFSTGQTTVGFTPSTGVHTLRVVPSDGFTAVDAVLSPDSNLGIDTTVGLSLAFNVTGAKVGDVASVTIFLQDSSTNAFNCSATITFTVVQPPSTCTSPPPSPGTVAPYPSSGVTLIQNPTVSVTTINTVVSIVNIQYNVNVQTTVNNYNSFTCNCCFNSCNTIVVTPPAPPVSPTPSSPIPSSPSASPPNAAPPPKESAPPPVIVEPPPPSVAPAPGPTDGASSDSSSS